MESGKLFSLVHNVCNGGYSPGELTEFVDLSQKIAISYLKYQEGVGKNIRPKKAEGINELEDVAIDCIAGLFMRNDDGDFVQLKRYFCPVIGTRPISDHDMLIMLRRLVVKKTKQELSRIFRERDPESAKILRNIRVAIRNSDQFISFRDMGREFVRLNEAYIDDYYVDDDIDYALSEKELFQRFLDEHCPGDSVSVMMKKMLTIMYRSALRQNYLAIDVIANIIRDVTFQQFKCQFSDNVDNVTPFNDLQLKEVDEINQQIVDQIRRKIYNQYFEKDKIDRKKANVYTRAITDFVYDLTHAKESESNYRYLKRYMPTLTQQQYREDERSIFEYLVKITKKSLRKRLKALL
ncbi:hypothetical protein JW960_18585 [candidate division KSB1 bacterium]|nr:hypothetical protein [candidate division KSB1 bacterium]